MCPDYKRTVRYLFIILAGVCVILLTDYLGFLEGTNSRIYDTFFRLRGTRSPSDKIIIAAIDEKSLQKLGRWPLERNIYARLLDKLSVAEIVGIDLLINEPSGEDLSFKEAISRHGRVVLPVYIDNRMNVVYPLEMLLPYKIGHVHIEQGVDSIVRKVFHSLYYKDTRLPSFPSVIHEALTSDEMPGEVMQSLNAKQSNQESIYQMDPMNINYYGTPGTFQHISVSDIVNGLFPISFFEGRTVLVGLTASGITDTFLTPFSQQRNRMAGVEVFANVLSNLLDESYIEPVGEKTSWIFYLGSFILLLYLFMKVNEKTAMFIWVISLVLITIAGFLMFLSFNIWMGPVLFYFLSGFAYVVTYFFKLDEAAVNLDTEYSSVASLLGSGNAEPEQAVSERGLISFLSTGGINKKIERLIQMEQKYERNLEATVRQRTEELSGAMTMINTVSNEMVMRLISAAESKDQYTGEHIARFGMYATTLSEAMDLDWDDIDAISFASLMHDIGKIGIPDRILLKAERLTDEEFKVIETHTTIGARILSDSSYPKIQMASDIALNHHERWDGTGYPRGLKGNAIPLEARIVMVCDHYDALRSKRPYKDSLNHETAFRIITEGDERTRPGHFDPDVLNAFVEVAPEFETIYRSHHD